MFKQAVSSRRILKDARDFRFPPSSRDEAILSFYESLDCARSLSLAILYRYRDFTQLVSADIDPRVYVCADTFQRDFAAVSFLRKANFLKTTIDRRASALKSFGQAEEKCQLTNRRFRELSFDPSFKGSNVWLLNALVRKIHQIVGTFDPVSWLDRGTWGPGVTQTVKGSDTSASRKFRSEKSITRNLYQVVGASLKSEYPHWFTDEKLNSLVFTPFSVVLTVPKNAKTDRTIGIEPGINGFFQLGLGSLLRSKLRYAGFDLNSSEKNSEGAREGSLTGCLATVDFSSASDTIATELVRQLLPSDWFHALDASRSHGYTLDGVNHPFAKFSAMGNGFTFELESLIFVSAALVCCEYLDLPTQQVSVFGDDIIIPSEAVSLYRDFVAFLGFTVNEQKSFSCSMFRESCGGYFFGGRDVKPVFLKEDVCRVHDVYALANRIRDLSQRTNRSKDFKRLWRFLVFSTPETLRLPGDRSHGDTCFSSNFEETKPSILRWGWEGYSFRTISFESVSIYVDDDAYLASKLHALKPQPSLYEKPRVPLRPNAVSLRATVKYRYNRLASVQQWSDPYLWF